MDSFFFVINILCHIVLTIYYPIYISRFFRLPLINPITVVFFVSLPVILFKTFIGPLYILEGGLLNPYFNFAILMANLALVTELLMIGLLLRTFSHHDFFYHVVFKYAPRWKIKRRKMLYVSLLFLLLAFFFFYLLTSHSFGFLNWIKAPRTGYQLHRTGTGQYFALALLFLSTSYAILLLYLKTFRKIMFFTLLYLFFVWFLGSKGFMLNFCIYTFIVLWFKGYKRIKKLLYFGIPIIFIPLLLNFGSFDFEDIASYFDYYVNSSMYYEEYFKGNIDLVYGKIALSQFWGMIPRALYSDKPYVYGFLLVNEHFFPGAAEATNTPAFGGPIAAFADFGVLGVLGASIFNLGLWFQIYCYYVVLKERSYEKIVSNPLILYAFLILFAPSFLVFFVFPLSFFIFLLLITIISLTNRLVIRYT